MKTDPANRSPTTLFTLGQSSEFAPSPALPHPTPRAPAVFLATAPAYLAGPIVNWSWHDQLLAITSNETQRNWQRFRTISLSLSLSLSLALRCFKPF